MLNVPDEFMDSIRLHQKDHPTREVENAVSPLTEYWINELAKFYVVSLNNVCCMCGAQVEMQIMKNTGVCSEHCRKLRDNDLQPWQGSIKP